MRAGDKAKPQRQDIVRASKECAGANEGRDSRVVGQHLDETGQSGAVCLGCQEESVVTVLMVSDEHCLSGRRVAFLTTCVGGESR